MGVSQHRVGAAKAVDGMKIRRAEKLVWVRLPPPAPSFFDLPRTGRNRTVHREKPPPRTVHKEGASAPCHHALRRHRVPRFLSGTLAVRQVNGGGSLDDRFELRNYRTYAKAASKPHSVSAGGPPGLGCGTIDADTFRTTGAFRGRICFGATVAILGHPACGHDRA